MAVGKRQKGRLLTLDTGLGEDILLINGFSATEKISGLFDFELDLVADLKNVAKVSTADLIGQGVTVSLVSRRQSVIL